ncbi:MAG: hypothetical protein AMXMBFR7_37290 [Planctomycetota bacterium]
MIALGRCGKAAAWALALGLVWPCASRAGEAEAEGDPPVAPLAPMVPMQPEPSREPAPPAAPPAQEEPKPPVEPAPAPPEPPAPPSDPAGETVELPEGEGERAPTVRMDPHAPKGPEAPAADLQAVRLTTEPAEAELGAPLRFLLRGPDAFLKTGMGRYVLRDEHGRHVAVGTLKLVELFKSEDGARIFELPSDELLGREHILTLALVGADDRRVERSAAVRLRRPRRWDGWRTLLHAPYPQGHWAALRELGVQGGMAYRLHGERMAALRMAGVPFYVENVAREFLARYHAEPEAWDRAVEPVLTDPFKTEALAREPSLCALEATRAYAETLKRHAEIYRADAPLFYSLASEPSVTRLGAAFDFDWHPEALREFRRWLEREVYGTLKALNEEWGTEFERWDAVVPMLTPEARLRLQHGIQNLAPWVDHREFMDQVFAKTLKEGGTLIRQTDDQARVGITGAQGPFAFGGWDWAKLAGALDVVEAYEIGGARELWRDLAPGKPALAMLPLGSDLETLTRARRTLWTLALEGGPRGVLLWDEAADSGGAPRRVLLEADGAASVPSEILAPALRELSGPLGLLLGQARRAPASVALVYSPQSVRVHWVLEADRLHGDSWLQAWGSRTSLERRESPTLRLRLSWMKLLSDLGLPWRFVSTQELAEGVLSKEGSGFKAAVLPRVAALGEGETDALRKFVQGGGLLVADASCGLFDGHGKRRERPALDDLFGLDTNSEPLAPDPARPLDAISAEGGPAPEGWTREFVAALPPAYSDRPKASAPAAGLRFEYRSSPVLHRRTHGTGAAVYLNLALEDYLRWRLHPDRPRAQATRTLLKQLVFQELCLGLPEDLERSELPAGAELVRLQLGEGATGLRILALRRNVQERLHELGQEGDTNASLDRLGRFKLRLRKKLWVSNPLSERPTVESDVLEGTLDPVTPALFVLREGPSPAPAGTTPERCLLGQVLSVRVVPGPGASGGPRVYGWRVKGPDKLERPYYSGEALSADGKAEIRVPLALNDPAGTWSISIRDATTGSETVLAVEVAAPSAATE